MLQVKEMINAVIDTVSHYRVVITDFGRSCDAVRNNVELLGSRAEAGISSRRSSGQQFECGLWVSGRYNAFFGVCVGKPSDPNMLVIVKNTAPEMKLLQLFILLMFVMSSNSRELRNCEFNFTYSGQPVVYNFSRWVSVILYIITRTSGSEIGAKISLELGRPVDYWYIQILPTFTVSARLCMWRN